MDDGDLRKIADLLDERINKALEPLKSDIGELKGTIDELKDIQENRLLPSVTYIETTVKSYADSYKINQRNIERLDVRLNTVEEELAIEPPEDLKVPHFAE